MQKSGYLAEAIATFALVFVGAGSVLANAGPLGVSLAYGLVLAAMVYATAHVSGAHINPAVTISMYVVKRIKSSVAAGYVISQLVGAAVAAYLLRFIYGDIGPSVSSMAAGIPPLTGLIIEAVFTFFFVFVFFLTAVHKNGTGNNAALALGFVFAAGRIAGMGLTGASMNPALVFGPASVSGLWANHLIYWIGPILGAVIAAYICESFFMSNGRNK